MVQRNSAVQSSLNGIKRIASLTRSLRRNVAVGFFSARPTYTLSLHISIKSRDAESQSSSKTSSCQRFCWRLLIDLPLLLLLLTALVVFEFGIIPSNKYGFYCGDPALSYPFNGDTITTTMLICGVLVSPVFIFFFTELATTKRTESKLWTSFTSSLRLFRNYAFGLLINGCILQLMKGLVGEPRPVFFALCQPDAALTCKGNEFVSEFQCTSKYSNMLKMDSYRSFPSGHSSFSVYCSLYLAWYLQLRAFSWRNRSVLIVPFLQLCVISFAVVTSLTRITDHRHHWWDVLAGTVIAIISVVYAVLFVLNNFSTARPRDDTTQHEDMNSKTDDIEHN